MVTVDPDVMTPPRAEPPDLCSIDGCDLVVNARGWCSTHYGRWRRTGHVGTAERLQRKHASTGSGLTPAERFWAKVDKTETCWLWEAASHDGGYGLFWIDGRYEGAHRWSYMQAKGPIPDGLELDHLCRTPACVNPAHLEAVTRQVNQHRSNSVSGLNARKTECPQGHPYDDKNTMVIKGHRHCRECSRARTRAWRAARKVAA